jgi:hypothetical protein
VTSGQVARKPSRCGTQNLAVFGTDTDLRVPAQQPPAHIPAPGSSWKNRAETCSPHSLLWITLLPGTFCSPVLTFQVQETQQMAAEVYPCPAASVLRGGLMSRTESHLRVGDLTFAPVAMAPNRPEIQNVGMHICSCHFFQALASGPTSTFLQGQDQWLSSYRGGICCGNSQDCPWVGTSNAAEGSCLSITMKFIFGKKAGKS